MTNKVLKAITDRMAEALPSETVKNPKLNVNSTSLVFLLVLAHQKTLILNPNPTVFRATPSDTPQPELKDPTDIGKIVTSRNDEEREIKWLDIEEPLDLVDTSEESVYESLIKEMPKCSLNYDFRIKKDDPRNLKIAFKTPYKDPERNELSSKGHDLLSSKITLSEDEYDRGCRKPSLEDGFYRDTIKLAPEYVTGNADEGEVA
ncbi:hypothetical protein Tco_0801479 [Tanacetum coccineum]|uniref:Uncharacterized protein n=1 Tax=Tanacetum coccineum TaxID=301880 RepID=A0ABQ4ZYD1_9ASTR